MKQKMFFAAAILAAHMGCGKSVDEKRALYARYVRKGQAQSAIDYALEQHLFSPTVLAKKARVLLLRSERASRLPAALSEVCTHWPQDLHDLSNLALRAGLVPEGQAYARRAFDCFMERGDYREAELIAHRFASDIKYGIDHGIDEERHRRAAFMLWAHPDTRLRSEWMATEHRLTERQALEIFEFLWNRGDFSRAREFKEEAPFSDERKAELERRYFRHLFQAYLKDGSSDALAIARNPLAGISSAERRQVAVMAFENHLRSSQDENATDAYHVAVDENLGPAYILRARRARLALCSEEVPFPPRSSEATDEATPTATAPSR